LTSENKSLGPLSLDEAHSSCIRLTITLVVGPLTRDLPSKEEAR